MQETINQVSLTDQKKKKLLLANEGNDDCPQNLFTWKHSPVIGWYVWLEDPYFILYVCTDEMRKCFLLKL